MMLSYFAIIKLTVIMKDYWIKSS